MNQTEARWAIGCAPETGAVQRLLSADEESVRIEALLPPDATVLVVTHQRALSSAIAQQVAATSAGISASTSVRDHAAARREVDRATTVEWTTSSIVVNGERHPASVLELLSGDWAGFVQYQGKDIAFGSRDTDLRDLRLATVDPLSLSAAAPT